MKNYESDLTKAQTELNATIQRQEQERLAMEEQHQKEIGALQQRVDALEVLVRLSYPHPDYHIETRTATAQQVYVAHIKPTLTQKVRQIMTASDDAFSSAELREKLQQLGWNFGDRANPWATIHTVCRNLVRQGFAVESLRGIQKVWMRKQNQV